MMRMRFHLVTVAMAVGLAAGAALPAHAQALSAPSARIDDIQVSREGESVSILVKLSQQPAAASAKASGDDLLIEIDGVDLSKLALDPPAGSLVSHVEAGGRKLVLSGAAFGEASTVIYRNAVMIEATLADPKLRGASLMASATPAPVKLPASAAKAAPAEPAPLKVSAPDPHPDKAIDLTKRLESRPAPVIATPSAPVVAAAPPPAAPVMPRASATALASIDTARCSVAEADVGKDPWAIAALGDHALCLLDQGKTKEASGKLEQLAAFAPEDWRVALGRAALAAEEGDLSNAEIGYRTAASLAPSDAIRAAIANTLSVVKLGTAYDDTP